MRVSFLVIIVTACLAANVHAQQQDSLRTWNLDPIVVTADRSASELFKTVSGISVVSADRLRSLPTLNESHMLSLVPGIAVLHFDGMGYAPQTVTRGFYGGGEAEYVVVLENGRPLNGLENGLVNWDQILRLPGTSVEVLRGGASSLYGDAAVGAVINLRTTRPVNRAARVVGGFGSYGIRTLAASVSDSRYALAGDLLLSDGFRDHGQRTSGTVYGSYMLAESGRASLKAWTSINIREYETPGPLLSTGDPQDQRPNLSFFRFDERNEKVFEGGFSAAIERPYGLLGLDLSGRVRSSEDIRTVPLAAEFADTQERDIDAKQLFVSARVSGVAVPLPVDSKIVIGIDAAYGDLGSSYFAFASGDAFTYGHIDAVRGDRLADGSATRFSGAGYAHLDVSPSPSVRISLGGRADWIEDSFSAVDDLSESKPSASHFEVSPKAGVNVRYVGTSEQVGNLYVSISRSFKAPTLDQLYDLLALPVPFPPFSVSISNALLEPQHGVSLEAGFYHRILKESGWAALLSGSVYSIDMKNEIDFSFETFSNVNIGESRHRGVELGLQVEHARRGSGFINYSLQDVTYQIGDNKGNAVKAIPKHALAAGGHVRVGPVSAGLAARGNFSMFVDDANTVAIPDYVTLDTRVAYSMRTTTLSVEVFNILDKEYYATAYPDPAGSEAVFYFPSAGRTVKASVAVDLN